ncbi:MAG: secondary thiamine-phosphate synthase enzyme YjbQ [Pseudomonadota bacterium]
MYKKQFTINSNSHNQLIDISHEVRNIVGESGISDGICYIFTFHTTAAITINENADPSVCGDILMGLNKISPNLSGFTHLEGNSDAHIKSSLVGNSVLVPIENSNLKLGTWQGIYFCEFDGPRNSRKILVQIQ